MYGEHDCLSHGSIGAWFMVGFLSSKFSVGRAKPVAEMTSTPLLLRVHRLTNTSQVASKTEEEVDEVGRIPSGT
jgi:hypothetical protein